jgi:hypothetical protein
VLVPCGVVVANTSSKGDPKGDTKGTADGTGFDLKLASGSDRNAGRPLHKVESWVAAGPGAVVLELKTSNHPGGPDFTVRKPSGGAARVLDHRGRRVAGATYKRLSSKSFSLSFSLAVAGNPPKYRWRWRVYGKSGTYDVLPNSGFVSHTVRYGGDGSDEHR